MSFCFITACHYGEDVKIYHKINAICLFTLYYTNCVGTFVFSLIEGKFDQAVLTLHIFSNSLTLYSLIL